MSAVSAATPQSVATLPAGDGQTQPTTPAQALDKVDQVLRDWSGKSNLEIDSHADRVALAQALNTASLKGQLRIPPGKKGLTFLQDIENASRTLGLNFGLHHTRAAGALGPVLNKGAFAALDAMNATTNPFKQKHDSLLAQFGQNREEPPPTTVLVRHETPALPTAENAPLDLGIAKSLAQGSKTIKHDDVVRAAEEATAGTPEKEFLDQLAAVDVRGWKTQEFEQLIQARNHAAENNTADFSGFNANALLDRLNPVHSVVNGHEKRDNVINLGDVRRVLREETGATPDRAMLERLLTNMMLDPQGDWRPGGASYEDYNPNFERADLAEWLSDSRNHHDDADPAHNTVLA